MRFSIVIPTYERREIVTRSVAALNDQTFRDFEVVVVDDGSRDGTADALRALEVNFPLTVISRPNEGASVARNVGAAAASGEFLVFLDDDMEADSEMLAEQDRSLREGADMVLGHLPLHPGSPDNLLSQGVGRWAEKRRARLEGIAGELPITELNTGQMSISRANFERLGGFDPSFTQEGLYGGEDLDLGYRVGKAGLRLVFNPAAISYQYYGVDPGDYTRRTRESGRSAQQLRAKHPELTQDLHAGLVYRTRRSRILFGLLGRLPRSFSRPLEALAAGRVRDGKLDFHTYRLFFGLQTMEFQRGYRQAEKAAGSNGAVVLGYHAIADLGGEGVVADYGVPPKRFAAQLDGLPRGAGSVVRRPRAPAGRVAWRERAAASGAPAHLRRRLRERAHRRSALARESRHPGGALRPHRQDRRPQRLGRARARRAATPPRRGWTALAGRGRGERPVARGDPPPDDRARPRRA